MWGPAWDDHDNHEKGSDQPNHERSMTGLNRSFSAERFCTVLVIGMIHQAKCFKNASSKIFFHDHSFAVSHPLLSPLSPFPHIFWGGVFDLRRWVALLLHASWVPSACAACVAVEATWSTEPCDWTQATMPGDQHLSRRKWWYDHFSIPLNWRV